MSEWTYRDQERFYDLILKRCRLGLTDEEFEKLETLHARRGNRIDFFPSSPDFLRIGAGEEPDEAHE